MLEGAGGAGFLAATASIRAKSSSLEPASAHEDGTPGQVHLTWGDDPATSMVISWVSPGQAAGARVLLTKGDGWTRTIMAEQRSHADEIRGQNGWAYHAELRWLAPDTTYSYLVTADNDGSAAPVSCRFRTAPAGRAAFRFTSSGDLGTGDLAWPAGRRQSAHAVCVIKSFQPLFHLLNGELCYPGDDLAERPGGWRDFRNEGTGVRGRLHSFRVGSALFVSLDSCDVSYQTAWLDRTLAAARADSGVDWIIVLADRASCSPPVQRDDSSQGIRQEWRPLFDRYEVDLLLGGHDVASPQSSLVRSLDWQAVQTLYPDPDPDPDPGTDGYGIAVFDLDPGKTPGGNTSITVRYFRASRADATDATARHAQLDVFTLTRPRSDGAVRLR